MLRLSILPLLGAALWTLSPLRAGAEDPTATAADSARAETAAVSIPVLLDTLLKNPDTRTETVKALLATGDEGLQSFYQNLFKGNVYEYTGPEAGEARTMLVIGGPEEQQDNETWVPLMKVYPAEPIRSASGGPVRAKLVDLVELETDREVRLLIQPVLTAMDLKSPDRGKRKAAALSLGESGDASRSALLKAALAAEKDAGVIHMIDEALARIDLKSPEPPVRSAAAARLGAIHSVNVLPELKAMIGTEGKAAPDEPDADVRLAMAKAIHDIESFQSFTGAVQNLFTGLSLGSILILMALGLAIIFGLMGVINMAHGEFMMIGAYATFLIQGAFQKFAPAAYFDWFLPVSLPLSFLAAGGVGIVVEMLIIKRLYGRPLETLLATWGLSLLFIQTARSLFGDLTAVSSPRLLSQGWEIFPQVVLPYNRIFIIFLTALIVGIVSWAFYRTGLGTKIRAVTQNRAMSSCLGIATRRVDALTFALGTGIAGVAGCALTQVGNVDPGMGQNYIVDSFMVVVTGGVGKLAGTVISGMGIGTLNKFLEPFLQSVYAKVALLGLVIFFLQNKPSGLFPAKGRNEDA
ncbi:MAG TPA: urea ABC transporter permease subunit UrtB [Fibrobacteria bacterium]|nr:urea ABC transporter permease subunit UrtB [Fibrobacteria bacterium]